MNNYVLFEEIGGGVGGSIVYRGREKKTIHYVAIKSVQKSNKQKLINEISILFQLNHPNIVKFFNWYETNKHLWIINEYCAAGNLQTILQNDIKKSMNKEGGKGGEEELLVGGLPEHYIKLLTFDILNGLYSIHCSGILHANLKSSSILLNEYGIAKLNDFSLSHTLPSSFASIINNYAKRKKGTPLFLAPELIVGVEIIDNNGENIDELFAAIGMNNNSDRLIPFHSFASDLWSFGIILFELMTGKFPFESNCLESLLEEIISNAPAISNESIEQLKKYYSPALIDLLQGCLNKDLLKRYDWSMVRTHAFFDGLTPIGSLTKQSLPAQPLLTKIKYSLNSKDTNDNKEYKVPLNASMATTLSNDKSSSSSSSSFPNDIILNNKLSSNAIDNTFPPSVSSSSIVDNILRQSFNAKRNLQQSLKSNASINNTMNNNNKSIHTPTGSFIDQDNGNSNNNINEQKSSGIRFPRLSDTSTRICDRPNTAANHNNNITNDPLDPHTVLDFYDHSTALPAITINNNNNNNNSSTVAAPPPSSFAPHDNNRDAEVYAEDFINETTETNTDDNKLLRNDNIIMNEEDEAAIKQIAEESEKVRVSLSISLQPSTITNTTTLSNIPSDAISSINLPSDNNNDNQSTATKTIKTEKKKKSKTSRLTAQKNTPKNPSPKKTPNKSSNNNNTGAGRKKTKLFPVSSSSSPAASSAAFGSIEENTFIITPALSPSTAPSSAVPTSSRSNNHELSSLDSLFDATDSIVKPLLGNNRIEKTPIIHNPSILIASSLPFPSYTITQLLSFNQTELENFLTMIYRQLASNPSTQISSRIIIINYLQSISIDPQLSNLIINSVLFLLLLKLLKTLKSPQLNIQILLLIAILVRYATYISDAIFFSNSSNNNNNNNNNNNTIKDKERENEDSGLVATLTKFLTDSNTIIRRRAICALGEFLFYISTQQTTNPSTASDSSASSSSPSSFINLSATIPATTIKQVIRLLKPSEDEIVRHYAIKAMENILYSNQFSIKWFQDLEVLLLLYSLLANTNASTAFRCTTICTISAILRREPTLIQKFMEKISIQQWIKNAAFNENINKALEEQSDNELLYRHQSAYFNVINVALHAKIPRLSSTLFKETIMISMIRSSLILDGQNNNNSNNNTNPSNSKPVRAINKLRSVLRGKIFCHLTLLIHLSQINLNPTPSTPSSANPSITSSMPLLKFLSSIICDGGTLIGLFDKLIITEDSNAAASSDRPFSSSSTSAADPFIQRKGGIASDSLYQRQQFIRFLCYLRSPIELILAESVLLIDKLLQRKGKIPNDLLQLFYDILSCFPFITQLLPSTICRQYIVASGFISHLSALIRLLDQIIRSPPLSATLPSTASTIRLSPSSFTIKQGILCLLEHISQHAIELIRLPSSQIDSLLNAIISQLRSPLPPSNANNESIDDCYDIRMICIRSLHDLLITLLYEPTIYQSSSCTFTIIDSNDSSNNNSNNNNSASSPSLSGKYFFDIEHSNSISVSSWRIKCFILDDCLPMIPILIQFRQPLPQYALRLLNALTQCDNDLISSALLLDAAVSHQHNRSSLLSFICKGFGLDQSNHLSSTQILASCAQQQPRSYYLYLFSAGVVERFSSFFHQIIMTNQDWQYIPLLDLLNALLCASFIDVDEEIERKTTIHDNNLMDAIDPQIVHSNECLFNIVPDLFHLLENAAKPINANDGGDMNAIDNEEVDVEAELSVYDSNECAIRNKTSHALLLFAILYPSIHFKYFSQDNLLAINRAFLLSATTLSSTLTPSSPPSPSSANSSNLLRPTLHCLIAIIWHCLQRAPSLANTLRSSALQHLLDAIYSISLLKEQSIDDPSVGRLCVSIPLPPYHPFLIDAIHQLCSQIITIVQQNI